RDAQQAAGVTNLQSRRVQLFLDGQYWGMYSVMERMSQPQAAAMYGGDPASYNVLKQSDTAGYEAEAGSDVDWRRLWDLTDDQVVTDSEYAEINQLIDVTSLARFIAINAYTANVDGAVSISLSSALGTNWIAVGGPGHPYTFLATDAELSLGVDQFDRHSATGDVFGPFPVLGDNPSYVLGNFNPGWLHSALLSNPQYRATFQAVASSLLQPGGLLDAGPSLSRWNARKAEVAPLMPAEVARWGHDVPGGPYSLATWQTETDWVETQFFPGRTSIVRDQLRAFLLTFRPGSADNDGYGVSRRLNDAHPVA
ncbi:MAG: CotH kinase family protein, partial [Ilumatobacteraceae bacterium]